MTFATNRILEQQESQRRMWKIYEELHAGKIIAVPQDLGMAAQFQGVGGIPSMPNSHDEIRYDYNSRTYQTRSQSNKIMELERQLSMKEFEKVTTEVKKKEKLQNLIAYYYKR